MMDLLWQMLVNRVAVAALADVGGGTGPSLVIDLLNLQWWQQLGLVLTALGLSPAPWILGLALGRIQFTKAADAAHQREIDALKEGHAREIENLKETARQERDQLIEYHKNVVNGKDERYADLDEAHKANLGALEAQRVRAETLTDALSESTTALKMTNHILVEMKRSAEEVTPDGG